MGSMFLVSGDRPVAIQVEVASLVRFEKVGGSATTDRDRRAPCTHVCAIAGSVEISEAVIRPYVTIAAGAGTRKATHRHRRPDRLQVHG